MAAQKKKARSSQGASSPIGKIIFIILLYGLAVLLTYITLAKPQDGTAMGSIRTLLFGLAGSFPIIISVFFAYLATVGVLSFGEHKIESWRAFLDGLLFLFFLTAVHLFTAEAVIRNRMTILTFANFVSKSYGYGKGGGALGALVSWPLYRYLGAWGGLLIVILLIVLDLTLSGRAGSFLHWIEESTAGYREESQQRREERRDERQAQDAERRERQTERRKVEERPQNPKRDEDIFFDELDDFGFVDSPKKSRKSYHEYDNDMPRRVNDAMQLPTRKPPRVSRFTEDAEPKPKRPKAEKPAESAKSDRQAEWDNTVDILQEEPKKQDKIHLAKTDERTFAAFDGSNRDEDRPKAHVDRPEMKKKPERKMKAEEVEPKPERKPEKKPKPELLPRENEADPLPIVPDESDVIEPTAESSNHMVTEYEGEEEYYYPPIDLLTAGERVAENHRDADMEKAKKLAETLEQFGISSKLTGIAHGPAVTRFELLPAPGVKVSKITNLADDIAMHLAAMSVRIEAPIPGKSAVGVEIPNDKIEMVRLRDVLESKAACDMVSKVAVGLGKDNSGRYIVADIAKMPHVLIAGQTGSGKSVCINAIITSILFRATPKEVRLILIDPKVVELSIYNDIPHLVCPVVTDCKKAASALQWAVSEMLMRYKRFAERGVRDIKGYNKNLKDGEEIMPQMVIIIDELADLMMVAPGEVEDSICRLAQLARAAGMHLVIATQRPSVNVVTGIIKANIPTRIAFSVASQVDSRTMIDHGGAEKLLGNGDMLFVPSGINKPMRVQGAWVSDEEVHAIVDYIKEGSSANYDVDMIEKMENAARSDAENEEVSKEYDSKLPEATEIVVEAGQASVSMLQRRMRIGYARAGRLIDEMQRRGIVSEADGSKPREVLITREQMQNMFQDE